LNAFIWDIDPTIVHLGPLQLRYYGIIFASMLYVGFLIWRWQALRGGYSSMLADKYLIWGVIGVLAGSRLGHCFFYEPERYLADPITILFFWKGGLASHGATIGVIVSLVLFARKYKLGVLETLDRFTMSSAVGAAAVRLGNFFNSEIVGRQTDLPWAVYFPLHDCRSLTMCQEAVPRHPSQLYEFTFGLFVLLVLYLADKLAKGEKRPLGMMTGIFLSLYFAGRFFVEFVKEYQVDRLIENHSTLTMGQYLSIIPFTCGVIVLVWSVVNARRTEEVRSSKTDTPPSTEKPVEKVTRKKKSKKRKK
jgi:phosphatidylglycerol:prolipoprotein diacylglycerol transferase